MHNEELLNELMIKLNVIAFKLDTLLIKKGKNATTLENRLNTGEHYTPHELLNAYKDYTKSTLMLLKELREQGIISESMQKRVCDTVIRYSIAL